MPVNKKKAISFKNPTVYFSPEKDKVEVTVASPFSYQYRQSRIEGYEARLYWQYRYCEEHNGQTFYYTLTYNDAAMPYKYGMNCFDYEDLRYLLNGGFTKMLLRKYGTKLKYFVGAELGDGKGKRGLHNNPHYHILFFLEPSLDARFPYSVISPEDFRHLVRMYWQGFDQSPEYDGYCDFKKARYGIAKEGENCGKVTDFRACMYCAKYVCKDVALKENESKIESSERLRFLDDLKDSVEIHSEFFHSVVFDRFNVPLNPKKTEWLYSDESLLDEILPGAFEMYHKIFGEIPDPVVDVNIVSIVREICSKYDMWPDFFRFFNSKVDDLVKASVTEWRNRYCNKCRISQGVGDYALEFVHDKLNPCIQVPDKDSGFKNRPLCQYFYRKLFTRVLRPVKPGQFVCEKPESFSPIRVLNEAGIKYKVSRLTKSLYKKTEEARSNLSLILGDDALFERMKQSDVNTEVFMSYSDLIKYLNDLNETDANVDFYSRYAAFKLVYEGRYFSVQLDGLPDADCTPLIDVLEDYKRFLVPSIYSVSRNDLLLDSFLEGGCQGFLPYSSHPYFRRFMRLFDVLDLCSDYFFVQKDDRAQAEAERIAGVKRFHDKLKLELFYSNFK